MTFKKSDILRSAGRSNLPSCHCDNDNQQSQVEKQIGSLLRLLSNLLPAPFSAQLYNMTLGHKMTERSNYTELMCKYDKLADLICRQCNCWSTYLSELDRQCSTECSFIDHATCVKPLIANFDPTESDSCLPGCLSDSFKQESIQYIRIGDQVRADETIQFTIEYNNLAKLVHEEEETYTAAKFQSDLGGAAGLILGLNTIMLLMLVIKGAKYILRSLSRLINRMWMRFQVNVAPFSRRPSVFNRQHATSPRSTWKEST